MNGKNIMKSTDASPPTNDPDEWLELQVFDRYDTVEQEIYVLIW